MNWNLIKEQSNKLYKDLYNTHVLFHHLWVNHILFTWRWWLAVSLVILPWIIWLIVRKKESQDRLLYAGLFIMLISCELDTIGIGLNLWYYPINVFPLMMGYTKYDISALPVATMLCIQFFPKVHPAIKALIYSLLGSLVFQPINQWLGLYDCLSWKDYYSIPILFFLYLFANHLATRKKFKELK